MGLVSSVCKHKKRGSNNAIVHNNYTQTSISTTANTLPSSASNKTQCSAISREPTNNKPSCRYHYCLPQQQAREYSNMPRFSTPIYFPFNHGSNISYGRSSPYIAHAYSHIEAPVLPSIHNTHQSRATSVTNLSPRTSMLDSVQTTDSEQHQQGPYRTVTHVESTMTTGTNEEYSKQNSGDGSRLIKRSASAPIDMFLIDISNEQVLIGQPVSMNIRHLLLDTLENHHTTSSPPIRIEPSTITTYAHENLLNYIPYVCERYPNITVDSNQLTRNTLHVRVPSEFSRSLNLLT